LRRPIEVQALLTGEVSGSVFSWRPPRSAFAGFRFPAEVIVVAVH
jgi:hypothetical protein